MVLQDVSIDDGVLATGVTAVRDGTETFDRFVAVRSRALLRTAYLLTHGEGSPGLVLDPGLKHTAQLRVLDGVPPDALLGLVWREQVP